MRVADARDFNDQAATLEDVGDADARRVSGDRRGGGLRRRFAARGMNAQAEIADDSPIEAIEPEYFVFANASDASSLYLRGFVRAAEAIAQDLRDRRTRPTSSAEEDPLVLGATWGLIKCKVPPSCAAAPASASPCSTPAWISAIRTSRAARSSTQTFVGQPVQDLHSHGTHCIGTACGPKAPAGTTPRYGIAYRAPIFVGKVLTNSGSGTTASVLAGMNWAIANRCAVISMSLGSQAPVQAAYTAAGAAALSKGCLIIAAAGNAGAATGVAGQLADDHVGGLARSEPEPVAASRTSGRSRSPRRDATSSRRCRGPTRYGTKSGTSMATPHVAGCAALWAETTPALRGMALWKKLQATARTLPLFAARVGAGLVQAP